MGPSVKFVSTIEDAFFVHPSQFYQFILVNDKAPNFEHEAPPRKNLPTLANSGFWMNAYVTAGPWTDV